MRNIAINILCIQKAHYSTVVNYYYVSNTSHNTWDLVKIGEYHLDMLLTSFNWDTFSHVTHLDQPCSSKNI